VAGLIYMPVLSQDNTEDHREGFEPIIPVSKTMQLSRLTLKYINISCVAPHSGASEIP
jgi:hypothetical protein